MSARRTPTALLAAALAWSQTAPAADPRDTTGEVALETYTPLATANRHAGQGVDDAFAGMLRLGGAVTSEDNFVFGQYNGLSDDGLTLIGDLQWQDFGEPDSYWQVSFSDLGLDTREGRVTWGKADRLRLTLALDSQRQVRNDSGRTPFSGDYTQVLPDDWVSGIDTTDFSALAGSLRGFDRELDRDQLAARIEARLGEAWRLRGGVSHERKEGHGDVGAGIYINGASADAVLLRAPVDYQTTEFDVGLGYEGGNLVIDGLVAYSQFDNDEPLLRWQNPYASYGDRVAYPSGFGGLGLLPDNEQISGRLVGHYVFSPRARFQFDGSYALATQDQAFADYTVNESLEVTQPLPAADLDGEVASTTANGKLLLVPTRKLTAEVYFKLRDRDYDVDRNGYLYVRGDATDQPDAGQTVYNTAHDLTSTTGGFEASYRLPLRSRLSAGYAYEEVERDNAAVGKTEEDRYTLTLRTQPWSTLSARLELLFADRAADTYRWDQSYYALLDTALINATPDNQRYLNHPELFQYYLANRERYEGKANLSFLPADRWNLTLDLLWRYDEYDQSDLGLTESEWLGAYFSASYAATEGITATVYGGYDRYDGNQESRAFRGGQEKNAFAIYPPLPQASDPARDWSLDAEDHTTTVGMNLLWRAAQDWAFDLDYSFVDTVAEQALDSGAGVAASDLPDVETRLHHVEAGATWHVEEDLSLRLDYRFFNYESDDWAWRGLAANSIDKVLAFGQDNPDEDVHYVGVSVIYRWQ